MATRQIETFHEAQRYLIEVKRKYRLGDKYAVGKKFGDDASEWEIGRHENILRAGELTGRKQGLFVNLSHLPLLHRGRPRVEKTTPKEKQKEKKNKTPKLPEVKAVTVTETTSNMQEEAAVLMNVVPKDEIRQITE